MKQKIYELTDSAKRKLMLDLCDELSATEINSLVKKYADRLELTKDGEPYIIIRKDEAESAANNYKFWLDINDVVEFVIDSEE